MLTRDQIAILILSIFLSQLVVNVTALCVAFYILMKVLELFRWIKDYLNVTKQYVDLINVERGRLARAMYENTVKTQQALEEKVTEIKQEIRQSASDTKTENQAEKERNGGS